MVVVIESNADDESIIVRALKKVNPPSFRVARDAQQALQMLVESHDQRIPRVVLLELWLPRMNGLEVLEILRSSPRTKYVPIVVLTDTIDLRSVQRAYDAGANAIVLKPIDFNEFTQAIENVCSFWLRTAAPAILDDSHPEVDNSL